MIHIGLIVFFFFSSRRRHTRSFGDWSSDVCSSDLGERGRLSSCIWNLGFFPTDARKICPFVLTSFTGWSSERCPGIGFLSRGDREIGVLRNVEPPTRPRLECLRATGLILRCDRKVGNPFQTKQGSLPSCRDQEGRRGSEEVVPGNLGVPLQGDRADRKSTRLNSSHQKISYAVFCLKKKKKKDECIADCRLGREKECRAEMETRA